MPTRDTADTWLRFVVAVTGDDRQANIAATTGLTQSTVSRWLAGGRTPHAESVILFARGYDVNPVVALVAAGLITVDEAKMPRDAAATVADVATDRLLYELARRGTTHEAAS